MKALGVMVTIVLALIVGVAIGVGVQYLVMLDQLDERSEVYGAHFDQKIKENIELIIENARLKSALERAKSVAPSVGVVASAKLQ